MILPKVSAIIPNYNHAPYLKARIESVISQSYKNLEIIILDDNSTDNSREIIESYKDHSLISKIIYNRKNSGSAFLQWKKGTEIATGDWIWFAESDDMAETDFVESMINALQGDGTVGLIYCDSKIIIDNIVQEETFADIKNKRYNTTRWSSNHRNNGIVEIEKYLLSGGTINNSSAVLFNRNLLLEVNPFDIPLKLIGDKYAFIKILAKSDLIYCKKAMNYYRDPFVVKKSSLSYAYEQFQVFNWIYKNLNLEKEIFYDAFYELTSFGIVKNNGIRKFQILYAQLCINPRLFLLNLMFNLVRPFKSNYNRIFKA